MLKLNQTTCVIALINVILAALIILFALIYQNGQPEIVTFDVKATLQQYQSALEEKNIAPSEQVKRIATFSGAISRATQNYSEEHNVIIMVPNAIVAGAKDNTHEIQKAIVFEYQASLSYDNFKRNAAEELTRI